MNHFSENHPLFFAENNLLKIDLILCSQCIVVCPQLIPQEYSTLLDPPQQVESFFPLRPDTVSLSSTEETRDISCAPPLPNCGSLPTGSPPLSQMSDHSEWEVISKHSTTSTRLSMRVDLVSPQTHLIPLWECLQVTWHSYHLLCHSYLYTYL